MLIERIKNSRIFFGLSSFQMLAMFRRGLFYSYLSIYLRYFLELSVTETTLFATLPMILNVSFQMVVWGVLSDKLQLRRTLVVSGEILAGIGTLIVFFTHRFTSEKILAGWIIIIGFSVVEIFWSMSNTGWTALISDLFPYEERNTVQGKLSSVGGLGRIFGVFIGGLLYDGLQLKYEGWGFYEGSLFFVAALVMFISTIPLILIPEGGIYRGFHKKEKISSQLTEIGSPNLVFFTFLIAMIFINFGRNSIAIILPQYLFLDSGFAVSSEQLSYIINTQSVAIILTGLVVGRIGVQFGNGNTLFLGTGISISALIIFAFSPNIIVIFLASFLRGASDVIILASAYTFASKLISEEKRARFFGIYNATFFLSWGLAGTLIAGPIIDILLIKGTAEVLSYQTAFVAGALFTFVGLIILGFLLLKLHTSNRSFVDESQVT
ncbi:MAG: MFS transporter [Candidatus Hodarchaeota archaeon]